MSHLFILFLFSLLKEVPEKDTTMTYVLPMFSFKSFTVSDLTFRCLIHFRFIFVLHVTFQYSQHHFLKRLSFLPWLFLPLSQIS